MTTKKEDKDKAIKNFLNKCKKRTQEIAMANDEMERLYHENSGLAGRGPNVTGVRGSQEFDNTTYLDEVDEYRKIRDKLVKENEEVKRELYRILSSDVILLTIINSYYFEPYRRYKEVPKSLENISQSDYGRLRKEAYRKLRSGKFCGNVWE